MSNHPSNPVPHYAVYDADNYWRFVRMMGADGTVDHVVIGKNGESVEQPPVSSPFWRYAADMFPQDFKL